jgi:hypothetical protein
MSVYDIMTQYVRLCVTISHMTSQTKIVLPHKNTPKPPFCQEIEKQEKRTSRTRLKMKLVFLVVAVCQVKCVFVCSSFPRKGVFQVQVTCVHRTCLFICLFVYFFLSFFV